MSLSQYDHLPPPPFRPRSARAQARVSFFRELGVSFPKVKQLPPVLKYFFHTRCFTLEPLPPSQYLDALTEILLRMDERTLLRGVTVLFVKTNPEGMVRGTLFLSPKAIRKVWKRLSPQDQLQKRFRKILWDKYQALRLLPTQKLWLIFVPFSAWEILRGIKSLREDV